ncbi:hypothetical protein [Alkaliphilus hydrothermalis]|uniref:Uncharacterized protein n=1 Tax=Alkaliphilus hydrothermalis TaxID=1482730 RepID=A0ABS2NKS3_9FIRM|nr:hypothetical protein [Alkaliphilus hydrothermalis]MBM7613534.1 hypothetical protein [Alkaliphilus hydrothermalis]
MKRNDYYKPPTNNSLLLENREEGKLIHQLPQSTMETNLESTKGKMILNEIR